LAGCATVNLDSLDGRWAGDQHPKHPSRFFGDGCILGVSPQKKLSQAAVSTSSAREKIEAAGGSCELICLINA